MNSHRVKGIHDDELRFGDEIECGIFAVDSVKKSIQISTRSAEVRVEILNDYHNFLHILRRVCKLRLQLIDKEHLFAHESEGCTWHPEFGAWMIESTPSRPYTNYVSDLLRVERNMVTTFLSFLNTIADSFSYCL